MVWLDHTKALGHAIGGRDIRGCKSCLWLGRSFILALSTARLRKLHKSLNIMNSLNEKEQDAQEKNQQEKEAIRARRYKGVIPT